MATIAIDYDGTFSVDPALWSEFITHAVQRGHEVICVTCRTDRQDNRELLREAFGDMQTHVPIVFTNHTPKRLAALGAGYSVDIWIDDLPEVVGADTPELVARLESESR